MPSARPLPPSPSTALSSPRVIDFPPRAAALNVHHFRVSLLAIEENGTLAVRDADDREFACDWLESGPPIGLAVGDTLLALPPDASGRGIVLGRIGPYRAPQPQARLTLEATEVLSLKCGDVTIDLRAADGKLMLRGDDVLLRAKGTQRIRAGTVAIN